MPTVRQLFSARVEEDLFQRAGALATKRAGGKHLKNEELFRRILNGYLNAYAETKPTARKS
jgi:hypothetical protein